MNDDERVTYFAETDARNKKLRFGIKKKDRSKHMYTVGKTGMGKSTMLESLAIQDIQNGEGLAFIDPHGKSADLLLEYVPEHRIKDVIYFAPFDLEHPISFNVLEDVGIEKRHLVVSGLMSAFKKIWVDAWSARMEYILANIMLALLEYPGSTLMGVNRMLTDKDFRKVVVENSTDPSVRAFWLDEYAKWTEKFASEAASAIQNKVGQFVANPLVRNIIGQPVSSFDIRKIMDEKKILIINLSKGRVGEANANLLGAMLITKIYLAAMSRADLNEGDLKKSAQFYLYVDEFQSFANETFADILSEARKYKLNLIIAHQYIEQMTEEVRAAVFGNVGTMVVFRVGAYDADVFQKEFAPQFTAEDIVNLQMYQMYLKLMIDGVTSTPFSAQGMTPITRPEKSFVPEIIAASREQFAHQRNKVEEEIHRWHEEKIKPVGAPKTPEGGTPGAFGRSMNSGGEGEKRPRSEAGERGGGSDRGDRGDRGGDRGDRGSGDRGERSERNDRPQRSESRSSAPRNDGRSDRGDDRMERRDERPREERPREDRPREERPRDDRPREERPRRDDRDNRAPREHADRREGDEVRREPRNREALQSEDMHDAVSLHDLKGNKSLETKSKNADKDAKPQNVLALKEALLGLLSDDKKPEPKKEEAKAEPKQEEAREEVKSEPRPSEHSNHGSHHHKQPVGTPVGASTSNGEVDTSELAKLLGK